MAIAALAIGAGAGYVAAYFLDPVSGRRRRKMTADRAAAVTRRALRRTQRAGRGAASAAYGVAQQIEHRGELPKDYDDATLAQKVETEIFRDPRVPKGQLSVNAQRGVVQLRGEVPTPEMIETLVRRIREVQGVRGVESLLHLPGTPARMHQ